MCELFAMSFNKPVQPSLSFRGFRNRGNSNPDGWGFAFYPDESAQIIKEPQNAENSFLSDFIKDYPQIKSKIFIAHVRNASKGINAYRNTHPFQRELYGREYVFAHNGTLDCSEIDIGRFRPVGETDSEHIFCHLLKSIYSKQISRWRPSVFPWLHEKLQEINNYGNFNCIFSDNEYLFCYRDNKIHYTGLCYVERKAPFEQVRLLDEDYEINLAEVKDLTQNGYIIATRPLTDEQWKKFQPGELIVFKHGAIVYSSSGL